MDPHKLAMRHSSKDATWRTPPAMVEKLAIAFPFAIDLAATEESAVQGLPWLGPGSRYPDALAVDWHILEPGCGFLNPPYLLSLIKELRQEMAIELSPEGGLVSAAEILACRAKYATQIAALRIENWAKKAYEESLYGFTTIGVFLYAPQTKWFRRYVMGHEEEELVPGYPRVVWKHAALDYWRIPHRVAYLRADGQPPRDAKGKTLGGANVNTCVIHWGPNPGFVGPWVPSGRFWSYR